MLTVPKMSLAVTAVVAAGMIAVPVHATTIYVGPTRALTTLAQGVAAAQPHDTLVLDQGTYTDQSAVISVPLTITGAGSGAVLHVTQPLANHKGILIGDADLNVSNITFWGAQVTVSDGNNGAGIRMENGNLAVSHCEFNDNQDGILANPNAAASITISNSTFVGNGAGDGFTHALYVNAVALLTVTNSYFFSTHVGHDIKSRALQTVIQGTYLDDGVSGTTSYAVDLPNGGVATLQNLRINQGPNTENPTMVSYGEEGGLHNPSSLAISNSIFTNTRPGTSIGVNNWTSDVSAILSADTFVGLQTVLQGPGQVLPATN